MGTGKSLGLPRSLLSRASQSSWAGILSLHIQRFLGLPERRACIWGLSDHTSPSPSRASVGLARSGGELGSLMTVTSLFTDPVGDAPLLGSVLRPSCCDWCRCHVGGALLKPGWCARRDRAILSDFSRNRPRRVEVTTLENAGRKPALSWVWTKPAQQPCSRLLMLPPQPPLTLAAPVSFTPWCHGALKGLPCRMPSASEFHFPHPPSHSQWFFFWKTFPPSPQHRASCVWDTGLSVTPSCCIPASCCNLRWPPC